MMFRPELEGATAEAGVATSIDTPEISEEERLRQEAAKRLERRRKMMSPEERLAKITGRPVEAVPDVGVSTAESSNTAPESSSPSTHTPPAVEDPPLEHLTRDPFSSDSPNLEGEFLTNMLAGQGYSPPPSDPVKYSQSIWLYLALAVRLMLETQYSWILGQNMLAPFLLKSLS